MAVVRLHIITRCAGGISVNKMIIDGVMDEQRIVVENGK
jgi:hypothetical protein